jgi:arylsulfatase A-like enzyme
MALGLRPPARKLLLCLFALCFLPAATGCAPPRAPNIVLIISDDHGWPDFGFMGSEVVETPHIDSLAREGMVFPNTFNTASVCRPSLLTLLTGLHPAQYAMQLRFLRSRDEKSRAYEGIRYVRTLPSILAEHGYASFQGGKYWEGTFEMGGFTHGMTHRYGEQVPPVPGAFRYAGGDGLALGRETMEPLWQFIDGHRDQPFFVWFAPSLPHRPFDAPQEYLDRYREKGLTRPQELYYANITRLDDVVGELVRQLEEQDLRDDTLIVFLTDNGWQPDTGRKAIEKFFGGSRGKASVYDLGYRTPLIFNWPGSLPAGTLDERLVSTTDVFATLLDFAGAQQPGGRSGASLLPLLEGEGDFQREQVVMEAPQMRNEQGINATSVDKYLHDAQAYMLRTPEWHYIWRPKTGSQELYDMREDPLQTRNVLSRHRELMQESKDRIIEWRAEMIDGVKKTEAARGGARARLR